MEAGGAARSTRIRRVIDAPPSRVVPAGISLADNETGWNVSLDTLETLVGLPES